MLLVCIRQPGTATILNGLGLSWVDLLRAGLKKVGRATEENAGMQQAGNSVIWIKGSEQRMAVPE